MLSKLKKWITIRINDYYFHLSDTSAAHINAGIFMALCYWAFGEIGLIGWFITWGHIVGKTKKWRDNQTHYEQSSYAERVRNELKIYQAEIDRLEERVAELEANGMDKTGIEPASA